MQKTSDTLQAAIDALGAVEVAPGKWAIPPQSGGRIFDSLRPNRWFITTNPTLILGTSQTAWDATLTAMPSWWTPERRFAWICRECKHARPHIECPPGCDAAAHYIERITASLETGEEQPC